MPTSSPTKKIPCDQCYERRVRCSGTPGRPCDICFKSQRTCTREKVRQKRGPKRSVPAVSAPDKLSRNVHRNTPSNSSISHFTPEPVPDFILSFNGNDGAAENITTPTSSNPATYGAFAARHSALFHGRARVSFADNFENHFTVNELADFIIGESDAAAAHPNSEWLLGLRTGLQEEYPTSATTSMSTNSITVEACNTGRSIYSNHNDIHMNDSTSSPSAQNATLDGTSLALVTGMPLSYGPDMVQCIQDYFSRVYHVLPIVNEERFRRSLSTPSQLTIFDRGLILAMCSATSMRCARELDGSPDKSRSDRGERYLEQVLKLHSDLEYTESTASSTITTAFLIHIACACMGKVVAARQYMREAISRAMDTGLHKDGSPSSFDEIETVCIQRTLALLFVTERATSIFENLDVLLLRRPPPLPDTFFGDSDRKTLFGFQCLYKLFILVDDEIVDLWCSYSPAEGLDRDAVRTKLHSLQLKLSLLSFDQHDLNDLQKADILVTRLWIRLIFWQIAMRLGLLSSLSENLAFSYTFPLFLAKELCTVLQSLHKNALLVHHFSIYSKIFEIAYSLMDVMMLSEKGKQGPGANELKYLFGYLSTSPINHRTYYRVLMERSQNEDQQSL